MGSITSTVTGQDTIVLELGATLTMQVLLDLAGTITCASDGLIDLALQASSQITGSITLAAGGTINIALADDCIWDVVQNSTIFDLSTVVGAELTLLRFKQTRCRRNGKHRNQSHPEPSEILLGFAGLEMTFIFRRRKSLAS